MHTVSNGFTYSFLCSGQPFAVTASYHSYHMLPLFFTWLCMLFNACPDQWENLQVYAEKADACWLRTLDCFPSISCLLLLWFATFSKPQVFCSWGSWEVIVGTHKVWATFQPQSWCAVLCVSTQSGWRNSQVEYLVCIYEFLAIVLDYIINIMLYGNI